MLWYKGCYCFDIDDTGNLSFVFFFTVSTQVITHVPSLPTATKVRPTGTTKMDAMCLCLLAEDRSITANIDAHAVSKMVKANSNSSNRQKAAFMKSLVDTQKVCPSPLKAEEVRAPSTAKMDFICLRLLAERRSITTNIDAHAVSKMAKANSNSSNRQKAAFMKSLVDTHKASKYKNGFEASQHP